MIQTIFDTCSENEYQKLVQEINKNVVNLWVDQYDNYVIQHLLEKREGKKCRHIYESLKGSIEIIIVSFFSILFFNIVERFIIK